MWCRCHGSGHGRKPAPHVAGGRPVQPAGGEGCHGDLSSRKSSGSGSRRRGQPGEGVAYSGGDSRLHKGRRRAAPGKRHRAVFRACAEVGLSSYKETGLNALETSKSPFFSTDSEFQDDSYFFSTQKRIIGVLYLKRKNKVLNICPESRAAGQCQKSHQREEH